MQSPSTFDWTLSLMTFLAGRYESTGKAFAVTSVSVSVLALKFLAKMFRRLYLLSMLILCMLVDICLKF